MDTDFVLLRCSVCEQSLLMKNSYGAIDVHCSLVNAPNYQACKHVKNCPLGKVMQ